MNLDCTHSGLGDDGHPSLQELVETYGNDWVIRDATWPSATRRRQLPLDVLSKTNLAMTVEASDLTELAQRLAEQTRIAAEHLGEA